MTALAAKRLTSLYKFSAIELAGKTETSYQGGAACIDLSTGLACKAFTSTNLLAIGRFTENKINPAGGTVHVTLDREHTGRWYANSAPGADELLAASIGSLAYYADDATLAKTSATSTRSIAGRVWKIDARKGVLVEEQF